MFRTIFWFFTFTVTLILTLPLYLLVRIVRLFSNIIADDFALCVVRSFARLLLFCAGTNVLVKGIENIPEPPFLLVSNHQGYFDIPLFLCCLPKTIGLIAKKELMSFPIVNLWMMEIHCIFIDRKNPRKGAKALNEASALLQNGKSLIIFPEGTRDFGAQLLEFKSGAFRVATKVNVPIVPVCIDGSHMVYEGSGYKVTRATVKMTVLQPVETKELSKQQAKELGGKIRASIAALL